MNILNRGRTNAHGPVNATAVPYAVRFHHFFPVNAIGPFCVSADPSGHGASFTARLCVFVYGAVMVWLSLSKRAFEN